MGVSEIILVGVALSMDACAITVADCAAYKNTITRKKEWALPIAFAVFQGIMPLVGYFIGSLFSDLVLSISKYLTAAIFFVLAAKIVFDVIKENVRKKGSEPGEENIAANLTYGVIALQALATSIDALAVGVTLVGIETSVVVAVSLISATTFALVTFAMLFGKKFGKIFGDYAAWIGAGILLVLAIKTLVEALI